jgi:hypothetical protein
MRSTGMRRLDLVVLAALAALVIVLLLVWPAPYVDERPYCSGVPTISLGWDHPLRAGCRFGPIPVEWYLSHPSDIALAVTAAIGVVSVSWFVVRRRAGSST